MYTITYKSEIEKRVKYEIELNKESEIAVLAMATVKNERISIEDVVLILKEGQTDLFAYIEPEMQLKFMKYCEIIKTVPVIIHTHLYAEKSVSFSPIDMKFIKAFRTVQGKMRCKSNSLFLVYGAKQVALSLMLNGKEEIGNVIDKIDC